MACSIERHESIIGAAKLERDRVKALLDQGYIEDEVNDIPDLQEAYNNMQAIISKNIESISKIKDPGRAVSNEALTELNMNNPRVQGKPVFVVSGRVYEDGSVTYKVKYPQKDKEYSYKSGLMTAEQVDPSEIARYGSEPDTEINRKYHTHLDAKIWEDQKAALELYDHLAGFDDVTDVSHKKYMRDLLEKITDPQAKVLNKFKVYINEKADKNGGAAVIYDSGSNHEMILDATRGGIVNGEMSAAEAYVHEMIHMSVEFARKFNKGAIAGTINELNHLYEKAAKKIKISDLVVNGDKVKAEKLWNYMFNNEKGNGLAEFIAYGMTNQKLREKLAEIEVKDVKTDMGASITDQILNKILAIWDAIKSMVAKDNDMLADEKLGQLVAQMWEHNNRSIEQSGLYATIKDKMEDAREYVDEHIVAAGKKAVDWIATGVDKTIEANKGNMLGQGLNIISTLAGVVNPMVGQERATVQNMAMRSLEKQLEGGWMGSRLFKQEGSVQATLNYLKGDDTQKTKIEKLGMLANNIDRHRQDLIGRVGAEINKALKGVSDADKETLTSTLLDLDMRVLYAKYSNEQVEKLLESDTKVKAAILMEGNKLEKMVGDTGVFNYYMSQTQGLGSYLVTHVGGSSVNRSARHIMNMKGTGFEERVQDNKKLKSNENEIVKSIDRLATLEGLLLTSKADKDTVVRVSKSNPNAIDKIVTYHNAYMALDYEYKQSHKVYKSTVKGEVKDLKASWIDVTVADDSEKSVKEMKKLGYRYKGEAAAKGLGIFTTTVAGLDSFDKGAAAKINPGKELFNLTAITMKGFKDKTNGMNVGITITDTYKEAAKKEVQAQMAKIKMPVMDGMIREMKGNTVTGFGVSVHKDVYKDATKQDRKVHVVLAKMLGEIEEKHEAAEINKIVYKEVLRDMNANYRRGGNEFGKNRKEYIEIGPNAKNTGDTATAYAKEVWNNMPADIKEWVNARGKGKQWVAIRRDMAADYFGRRAPSILDAKVPFTDKTIEEHMKKNGWDTAVEGVKLAGDIWQEAVKDMKIDAVIKSPKILWNNIVSNVYLQSVLGQTPWGAVIGQVKMFQATKEYLKLEKREIDLKMLIRAKKATLADKAELRRVEGLMKDSPVYDTMKAGLFTGISDEMNTAGLTGNTRLEDVIHKYTGKLPKVVRSAGSILYMTKDTWMYKVLTQVMQYSDFVYRSSRYQYLISKGVPKNVALKMVTDEAVNYDRDLGPELAWTKKMGFWWFFNYFLGATKMMASKAATRPSALLLMEMSNINNPMDAAIWNKNFGFTAYGPLDLAFEEAPSHVMNPALLKATGIL